VNGVGAPPPDREPDRVAAESAEGAQDADDEGIHDTEVRGDAADDEPEVALDRRGEKDRDRSQPSEKVLHAISGRESRPAASRGH
jgi:hypothetical protein